MWGIGAFLNLAGTMDTNATNDNINMRNMSWQENLSNTAVQRRRKDMELAGINPILAANQGASTPSVSPIPMQNPGAGLNGVGANAMTAAAQIKNINADTDLKAANASLARAHVPNAPDSEIDVQDLDDPTKTNATPGVKNRNLGNYEQDEIASRIAVNKEAAPEMAARVGVDNASADQLKQAIVNAQAMIPQINAQTTSAQASASVADDVAKLNKRGLELANILSESEIPQAKAAAEFYKTQVGKATGAAPALALLKDLLAVLKGLPK